MSPRLENSKLIIKCNKKIQANLYEEWYQAHFIAIGLKNRPTLWTFADEFVEYVSIQTPLSFEVSKFVW